MSAMIIIMSIVAIGAVMALRNKIANKRRRRTQAEESSKPAPPSKQPPTETRPNTESESKDVDSLLAQLKEDSKD